MQQTEERRMGMPFLSAPVLLSGLFALTLAIGFISPRSLSFLPALLGLGCFAVLFVKERDNMKKVWVPFLISGGVLAFAALSSVWSIDPAESLERCLKMTPVFIFGTLLYYSAACLDKSSLRPLSYMLPFVLLFGLVWNSIELLSDGFLYKSLTGRFDDPDYTPATHNRSILLCLIFVPFTVFALRGLEWSKKQRSALGAGLLALLGVVLTTTESQTAQLALVLGLAAFLFWRLQNKILRIGFMLLLAGLILSAPFLSQYLFHTLPEILREMSWFRDSYAAERLEIWDFVSRYALQNPLYGFGIEATRAVEAFDTAMLYRPVATVLHPHNFAIQLWMEFGVIGALGGIIVLAYWVERIAKLPASVAPYIFASFIMALTVVATAYGLWQGWWIGTIFLLAAYTRI